MTTKFSGVKILRYPIPRVTSPIAFIAFGDELKSMSPGLFVQQMLNIEYDKTKYNAMYTLRL